MDAASRWTARSRSPGRRPSTAPSSLLFPKRACPFGGPFKTIPGAEPFAPLFPKGKPFGGPFKPRRALSTRKALFSHIICVPLPRTSSSAHSCRAKFFLAALVPFLFFRLLRWPGIYPCRAGHPPLTQLYLPMQSLPLIQFSSPTPQRSLLRRRHRGRAPSPLENP